MSVFDKSLWTHRSQASTKRTFPKCLTCLREVDSVRAITNGDNTMDVVIGCHNAETVVKLRGESREFSVEEYYSKIPSFEVFNPMGTPETGNAGRKLGE